jgi:DNA-binding CsgD family transcriptional regulator
MAALLDTPAGTDYEQRVEQAETEIDNLRAAFAWSRENSATELALTLASSLRPLWETRGRILEGLVWFDTVLAEVDTHHPEVAAAVWARGLANRAVLAIRVAAPDSLDQAQHALAIAREVDEPRLLVRALTARGFIAAYNAEPAEPYFAEGLRLARALDDPWTLAQILVWQARSAQLAGDLIVLRAAAEEGRELAQVIGDRSVARQCRYFLAMAQVFQGDMAGATAEFVEATADAKAAHDRITEMLSLLGQSRALTYQGESAAARAAADAAVEAAVELGGQAPGLAYLELARAALAAGDAKTAQDASDRAWQHLNGLPAFAAMLRAVPAEAALAAGDLLAARRWADEAVSTASGWRLVEALQVRARVAIAQGEPERAERDAHDALAAGIDGYVESADTLECLGMLAGGAGSYLGAARLFGAAHAIRQRTGAVRLKVWDADYQASVAELRAAMSDNDFDSAWSEGLALSTEEAIAYAQRGRGERKRPASGWGSLTPAERDVVRLVSEGLANNDIAARLFVSPRTVQTHLTHVYTKLGLTSRVQLVQEAARHT